MSNELPVRVAQSSTYEEDDWWSWSVWIEGPDDVLSEVEQVVYRLHPSFPRPVRVLRNRESKFKLDASGWGTFRLYAEVVCRDGRRQRLHHDLVFDQPPSSEKAQAFSAWAGKDRSPQTPVALPGPRRLVLIGHRGRDAEVAKRFQEALQSVAGERLEVELYSVPDHQETAPDHPQNRLERTDWLVLLYTPSSDPDWLLYEWGVFIGQRRREGHRPYSIVCSPDVKLPEVVADRRAYRADRSGVRELCNELLTVPLRRDDPPIYSDLPDEAAEKVISALVEGMGQAPFSLDFAQTIRLLIPASRMHVMSTGVIPEDALVAGGPNAMEIFSPDTRAGTYTWKEVIDCVKLAKGDELPALLWSAHLGRCIAAALASRSFRPALPTLFSLSTSKAYRPVLSKMERGTDGSYAFHVSFAELPPELNAWPPGELGIVTHVLTLTRMFCWGVLLPFTARFSDLAKRPESRTDIDAAYNEFEAAISNVTVDARNRGLTREMYVPMLASDAKERATLLLKEWDDVFREFKDLSYGPLKQARDALQIVSKMIVISQGMMKLFARRYAELLEKTLETPHVGRANTLLFGASAMGILESESNRLNAEAHLKAEAQ